MTISGTVCRPGVQAEARSADASPPSPLLQGESPRSVCLEGVGSDRFASPVPVCSPPSRPFKTKSSLCCASRLHWRTVLASS